MSQAYLRRCAGLLILAIAAAGCGKRGTVPLSGTVTLDGRPLARATVHFIPQDPEGREALGSTDAEGVFHLSTFKPGDGAYAGKYKVIVRPATEVDPELKFMTPAEAMDKANAGRKPSRPSVVLPPRYTHPGQTVLEQDVPASGDVVFELTSK